MLCKESLTKLFRPKYIIHINIDNTVDVKKKNENLVSIKSILSFIYPYLVGLTNCVNNQKHNRNAED